LFVAAHRLSSRTFRNTHSTPSAADSEFSPAIIEFAFESPLRRRGRKFAESAAFFGGVGSGWADKFRLLPFVSALSVVKTAGTGRHLLTHICDNVNFCGVSLFLLWALL
jgi:hypothetical protein